MTILCRLCAKSKNKSEIKTTLHEARFDIQQKLLRCCDWKVNLDFHLPQNVCTICFDKLEQSWLFAENVAEAQLKLKSICDKNQSKQITEKTKLICRGCNKVFTTRIKLEKHECQTNLLKQNQIENSADNNSRNEPFLECSPKRTIVPNDDERIVNQRLQDEQGSCLNNNKTKNVATDRNQNKMPVHSAFFFCHLCNKEFKKFALLKYHMDIHTLPRRYKCKYCNSKFRTKRHYSSHQKKHIDYFCLLCNKKFPSAFTLKVHERMHIGSSVKMYGCGECDHFFTDVSAYYNHMRRLHGLNSAAAKTVAKCIDPNGSAKPFVCEQCGKGFIEKNALRIHSVIHSSERPFKCDVCDKAFKNKYNLKSHQKIHTAEKPVQCTDCGKRFSRKSVLVKHMELHTGLFSKTYPCDYCDKHFRTQFNLTNHRRTHTGEKPFICNVCAHSVATKTQLERHLKTKIHLIKSNEMSNK